MSEMPLPERAAVAFRACRRLSARRVVAVRVSAHDAVALASAIHDTCRRHGGLLVLLDENEDRLQRALAALQRAGLDDYAVALRGGLAARLATVEGPIDFMWFGARAIGQTSALTPRAHVFASEHRRVRRPRTAA